MTLTEHTLNDELGNLLDRMRRRWRVQAEPLGAIEGSAQRPDILISENGALPVIIEHETSPARNVEDEARARIGLRLRDSGREIRVAIALRSPHSITQGISGAALRRRWLDCDELRYVMYRRRRGADLERWPAEGWLSGTLRGLALFIQQAMRPGEEIDELAEVLETRIGQAAEVFNRAWPHDDARASELLREQLRLEDDGVQTRRMAMAILANALIFQQSLAQQLDGIEPPSQLKKTGRLNDQEVLQQWRRILEINYWPIFHAASEILQWMDRPRTAARILDLLHQVNLQIELSDAARSHDLTGFVFQRLIADRKFLATFYTRPESAALLAALALPVHRPLAGADWGDALTLSALQIGDFACGTGTLLSAVYQRLGALHELHGGDAAALHKGLLEQALVGCDVLPLATHLTLTMLASAYPEIRFDDCHMLVMPYGRQPTDDGEHTYSLGALDLLMAQEAFPTLSTRPEAVGGSGESSAQPEQHKVEDGSFDLVIMNPPFTRPTGHAGERIGTGVPPFAALGTTAEDQRAMSALLSSFRDEIPYHGNAGLASAFFGLANRKLRNDGSLALVMPLAVLSGISWAEMRSVLRKDYKDLIVVTIAADKAHDKSFSADTGLGECLLIAQKSEKENSERAKFVTLRERPRNQIDGEYIGNSIHVATGIRKLEDGTDGGTSIQVGEDEIGQILDFPLTVSNAWQLGGVLDFSLAQTVFQLTQSVLALPRTSLSERQQIPITTLDSLISRSPLYHMDIFSTWNDKSKTPRAPFDIKRPAINPVPTYPVLWAHNAPVQRFIELKSDSEAIARRSSNEIIQARIDEKVANVWSTATRIHQNRDFRFNSQSICVAATPQPSIGGRAWPAIVFPETNRKSWEPSYSIWSNSTLGIVCYWWICGRQDSGRGTTSVTALPALPTLDLRTLSDEQLEAAEQIFEDMKHCPMLPVNQIDEDPVRAELDRRLLTEVLGLPEELCAPDGPMALLRRKLAAEPSIHGGKKSKVSLDLPEGCLPA